MVEPQYSTPLPSSEDDHLNSYQEVAGIFINHPHFERVYREVSAVLLNGIDSDEAACLHVSGPPGVGKTTLRRKLASEFALVRDGRVFESSPGIEVKADYVPLIQIELPERPTVKTICREILRAYGDGQWRRGDEYCLTDRVDKYIQACGTIGILIDEAQRVVDRQGVVVAEHLFDWFKSRHSRNGVAIILLGLGRLRYLFEQDSQIERRWDAELRILPYRWRLKDGRDDITQQNQFMGILATFKDMCPIPFEVDVTDDAIAYKFFYASQGVIGNLKKLLKRAVRTAALEPERHGAVTEGLLYDSFELAFRRDLHSMENPFCSTFSFGAPPALDDDTILRPSPRVRSSRKARAAQKAAVNYALTQE